MLFIHGDRTEPALAKMARPEEARIDGAGVAAVGLGEGCT